MSAEAKIEAWIAAGRKAMADAVVGVPSHEEMFAAGEALLRHIATVRPDDMEADEAPPPIEPSGSADPPTNDQPPPSDAT